MSQSHVINICRLCNQHAVMTITASLSHMLTISVLCNQHTFSLVTMTEGGGKIIYHAHLIFCLVIIDQRGSKVVSLVKVT